MYTYVTHKNKKPNTLYDSIFYCVLSGHIDAHSNTKWFNSISYSTCTLCKSQNSQFLEKKTRELWPWQRMGIWRRN